MPIRILPALGCLCVITGGCAAPIVPAGSQFDGTYEGGSRLTRGFGYVCALPAATISVTVHDGRFDYIYDNYELAKPVPIPVQIAADGTFSGQIQYLVPSWNKWGSTPATWAMLRGRVAGKTLDATLTDYYCIRQFNLQTH
jgi:hypothetical protein